MRHFAALGLGLAALFVLADESERTVDPKELAGADFLLEAFGGTGVRDIVQPTLKFESEKQVAGNGGCNRFFGPVKIKGDSVRFGPLGSTRRMCPEAVMDQEQRYLAALEKANRIGISGPYLLIHSEGAEKPLKFTRLVKDPGERPKE